MGGLVDNVATYVHTYTAEVYKPEAPFHGWKFYSDHNQEIFKEHRHRGSFEIETTFIHPKERVFKSKRVTVDLDKLQENEWYDIRLVAVFTMNPKDKLQ